MSKTLLAHIALFVVQVLYAGSYTIAKIALPDYIRPNGFILLRVLTGFAFFMVVHYFFIREKVDKKDLPLLFLCGIFGAGINQLSFFKGLSLTTAIDASLIVILCPILVLPIAAVLIGERITWRKSLGILLGALGAAFLIVSSKNAVSSAGENRLVGNIFLLFNATAYAFYLVLIKSLLQKYHPFTVLKWVFLGGLVLVFPFGIQQVLDVEWHTFDTSVWLSVGYVLFGITVLVYLLNAMALRVVSSAAASAYIYAQPFLAAIIAMLAGKEVIAGTQVVACVVIFMGLYLVSDHQKKEPAQGADSSIRSHFEERNT